MRYKILFIILLLPMIFLAQDKKIYLDSLNFETVAGKHKYYRIIKDYYSDTPKKIYRVVEYYNSDKIRMTGTSTFKDNLAEIGQFVYYHENGNKKASAYFVDNTENGNYFEWYENGNPKIEGVYIPDETQKYKSKLQVKEYWDSNNMLKATGGNGDYEEITDEESHFGKIKDGFKDGVWTGNNKKIKYSYTETYANNALLSGVSIDSNKVERTYKMVEIPAEPKGGIEEFYRYIGRNFQVPPVEGLKGKIYTKFEIDLNGNLINPKVIRDIGHGTNIEILRVLRAYNQKWSPKEIRGIKIVSTYSFPINIQSSY